MAKFARLPARKRRPERRRAAAGNTPRRRPSSPPWGPARARAPPLAADRARADHHREQDQHDRPQQLGGDDRPARFGTRRGTAVRMKPGPERHDLSPSTRGGGACARPLRTLGAPRGPQRGTAAGGGGCNVRNASTAGPAPNKNLAPCAPRSGSTPHPGSSTAPAFRRKSFPWKGLHPHPGRTRKRGRPPARAASAGGHPGRRQLLG